MDKREYDKNNNDQSHVASQEVLYFWDTLKQQWVEYATISANTPVEQKTEARKRRQYISSKKNTSLNWTQIKDDDIFRYILRVAPGMKQIIAHIRESAPARSGEYDSLLDRLHNKPFDRTIVENRLFDLGSKIALKNALLCSVKYKIDIEDAFQVACIGLLRAIREHNALEANSFPVYCKRLINLEMNNSLPIYEKNFCLPPQEKGKIQKKLHVIERKESDIELVQELSKVELSNLFKESAGCNQKDADQIANILVPFDSTEEFAEKEEMDPSINSDCNTFASKMIESIEHEELRNKIATLFESFTNDGNSRMVSVLKMRYGFDGLEPMTLEQIGVKLKITRERVRQIEVEGLKLMKHSIKPYAFSSNKKRASIDLLLKPKPTKKSKSKKDYGNSSSRSKKKNNSQRLQTPMLKANHSQFFPNYSVARSGELNYRRAKKEYELFIQGYDILKSNILNLKTGAVLFDASINKLSLSREDRIALRQRSIDLISEMIYLPNEKGFSDHEQERRIRAAVLQYLHYIEEIYKN